MVGDEEKLTRLKVLARTYERGKNGQRISGFTNLMEILIKKIGNKQTPKELVINIIGIINTPKNILLTKEQIDFVFEGTQKRSTT